MIEVFREFLDRLYDHTGERPVEIKIDDLHYEALRWSCERYARFKTTIGNPNFVELDGTIIRARK